MNLLGKSVGFLTMKGRLNSLWKPVGGFHLLDLGYGFFLVKFDMRDDRLKALERGTWMLFDHYLSIRWWSLDFVSSSATIDSTLVWICFPSLNVGYYDEDVLMYMASVVREPMKIDLKYVKCISRKIFSSMCENLFE